MMKYVRILFWVLCLQVVTLDTAYSASSHNRTLDGKAFDLESIKGKVVVVSFWAYWCPNCVREMSVLEALYQQYQSKGVEIIGISVDKKSERQESLKRAEGLSYPNLMRYETNWDNLPTVRSVPATYVFDKYGTLRARNVSGMENWKKLMEEML